MRIRFMHLKSHSHTSLQSLAIRHSSILVPSTVRMDGFSIALIPGDLAVSELDRQTNPASNGTACYTVVVVVLK